MIMEPQWKTFLKRIYFDPKHPGSFAGPTKVQQILKSHDYHPTLKSIKLWLQDQDAYSY